MRLFSKKPTAISVPVIWKTREQHELDTSLNYEALGLARPKDSDLEVEIENAIIKLDSICAIHPTYNGDCVIRTIDTGVFNVAVSFKVMESILMECGWHITEVLIKK